MSCSIVDQGSKDVKEEGPWDWEEEMGIVLLELWSASHFRYPCRTMRIYMYARYQICQVAAQTRVKRRNIIAQNHFLLHANSLSI